MSKDWIQGAIRRPGAFSEKAKNAGMTTRQYITHVLSPKSNADDATCRQANLAKTLMSMNKGT